MPTTIEVKLYKYDELPTDKAKEKACEWWCEASANDTDWFEHVYEDAQECARLLGIDVVSKSEHTVSGRTFHRPAFYFTGFWSQGDGACFDGTWSTELPYRKPFERTPNNKPSAVRSEQFASFVEAIRSHAPKDDTLQEIASDLDKLAAEVRGARAGNLRAECKHSGHYYHSGCMSVDPTFDIPEDDDSNEYTLTPQQDRNLTNTLRSFADWLYGQLEESHDDYYSTEQVEEAIRANEYDFEEDGTRSRHNV